MIKTNILSMAVFALLVNSAALFTLNVIRLGSLPKAEIEQTLPATVLNCAA